MIENEKLPSLNKILYYPCPLEMIIIIKFTYPDC